MVDDQYIMDRGEVGIKELTDVRTILDPVIDDTAVEAIERERENACDYVEYDPALTEGEAALVGVGLGEALQEADRQGLDDVVDAIEEAIDPMRDILEHALEEYGEPVELLEA